MNLDAQTERELWRKCADGDISAREELIVSYRPLVYWIASKIHVDDSELRKDIIQEGMLALIRAVDKFDPQREYKFSTYAYHKIRGQIINLLERSEKRAPMPVPDEYLTDEYSVQTSGDDWLDASTAISKLHGREAEIMAAMFYEGKNPRQIADEHKLDISRVYRLKRSAIEQIRQILGLEGV